MPFKVDAAKVLEMSMGIISLRVLESATGNGLHDSSRTLDYANSLRIVKEVADTLVRPDDKLQQDLQQLGIKTSDYKVPTIHQLSKGQHTVDVIPITENEDNVSIGESDGEASDGAFESAE